MIKLLDSKSIFGLTFDDIILIPNLSNAESRETLREKINTRLTKNILIKTPIVSANMSTVTESETAIALAQEGGIGIIHRGGEFDKNIEKQVAEVIKVKRKQNFVIANPVCLSLDKTLEEARKVMQKHSISSVLVVNDQNQLVGILTHRNWSLKRNFDVKLSKIMTANPITAPPDITIEQAQEKLEEIQKEKLPLVDSNGKVCGLITRCDLEMNLKQPYASKDQYGRLLVGAAIGARNDYLERAQELLKVGTDVLVMDIAHGYWIGMQDAILNLKKLSTKNGSPEIIAGNVATPEGTKFLIEAGADAVKVGIGPGAVCTTRIMTGCGVPQLHAIAWCADEAEKYNVPVIADGGIKYPGDIVKSIAAGASSVMVGSYFAGCDETPGKIKGKRDGSKVKVYRGMASFDEAESSGKENRYIEGENTEVPYRGPISSRLFGEYGLIDGLLSGLSYVGKMSLEELRKEEVLAMKISYIAFIEGLPHATLDK